MSHAVHYRTDDGSERFTTVASLDEAIQLVEQLRNDSAATDVRVFREIPIQVKAVYKVTVVEDDQPAQGSRQPSSSASSSVEPPPGSMPLTSSTPRPPATETEAPSAEHGDEDSQGKRSLFSRS